MPPWNVVLQLSEPGIPNLICQRFSVPGIAYPCRVVVYACDPSAGPMARSAHALIEADLNTRAETATAPYHGPDLFSCQTWSKKDWV